MSWKSEFPDYKVDRAIRQMVKAGYVRDDSDPYDPAPSFVAPLYDKRWLRLWVEHPDPDKRRAGPHRYRIEVTASLKEEGRPWIETDELSEAVSYMLAAIEEEGFRLSRGE
jgi:hypothetical protein